MNNILADKDNFISQYWSEATDERGKVIALPRFGDRLRNGAKVVAYKHIDNGSRNWYPNGTVLANIKHGIGEWVVWTAIYDFRDEKWYCENGHYFDKFESAAQFFMER